ncbi:MAG: RDD family protein [Methylotenera sp.]|uniref:RDD family protein n=1 Tax=Methylotenera sp. TaxID=2051956 RepID=UPI0024884DCA|nr:RDD family protein [Methylotenera sp.]MDI1309186.1 RDD family protein [Methylotenera sp.]
MQTEQLSQTTAPSFFKLGACLIYEALVVTAISLATTAIFVLLLGEATGIKRYLLQLFLWLSVGMYFVWCWQRKGQTLAMQTWQLKLLNQDAQSLPLKAAIARYILATFSLMLFSLGFLWIFVDRDRLFLHDRLLKNKIIYAPRKTTLQYQPLKK